ncbi:aryl-alcohol dehydrogenase-like predicted oxidoreductase [Tamaricihabitans halophyticus]|uniref:Aryl-alcohol dehydrogenase-like predicted oxidoreductase n=1 Tax=Tamaricihabitans halophyticus TaxID=1262583 RepID=A0A4V2SV64_9PSEU|nr:aldo/keto reductase [Tamaricihabitans halophyticus]TCP57296.1 aryl-alcohol dehydrogenase-like predicted oxidoreductase [Tamaricihabitans halophyticus]
MQYRQLGRSGLRVSTLTMGTMTFGGRGGFAKVGSTDLAAARRQIDMCVAAGVNFVDTANMYSAGLAEEIVGQAVAGKRDSLLLSTKVRLAMGEGQNDAGLSRHHIIREAEASLRRLRTDYIDVYHTHGWDGQTPLEETMEALDSLVRSGKVRYLGASNYAGWQLMKALAVADKHGYQRFVSNQIYYSLESRDVEYELVPASLDQGLGIMVWSPLAGGLLSGKYRRGTETTEGRSVGVWDDPPVRDKEKLYDTIDALVRIAEDRGAKPAQIALAYLLAKPGVTTLVVGARRDEQLRDNLAAAEIELTTAEFDELDRISRPWLIYPMWHQIKSAADRFGATEHAAFGGYLY